MYPKDDEYSIWFTHTHQKKKRKKKLFKGYSPILGRIALVIFGPQCRDQHHDQIFSSTWSWWDKITLFFLDLLLTIINTWITSKKNVTVKQKSMQAVNKQNTRVLHRRIAHRNNNAWAWFTSVLIKCLKEVKYLCMKMFLALYPRWMNLQFVHNVISLAFVIHD